VLPIPVDLGAFRRGGAGKAARPVILSLASFDERRKGVRVMVKAFALVKQWLPDAELQLSGSMSDETRREVLDGLPEPVRKDICVLGAGNLNDLPELYRRASLMVLPSVREGFGMVVIEAWACGTPVVVSNDGAFPELVSDPRTGVLFEPREVRGEATNAEGLAEAIKEGLKLAGQPETSDLCARAAQDFSWEIVGPRYEELYKTLIK
jgi:glycosyltransferase involved in cell wall biosynthesis